MRQSLSNCAAIVAVLLVFTGLIAELHAQTAKPRAQSAAASAAPATEAGSRKTSTIVNLNTASVSDLEELPGIGAKTAARIIEYRQKRGAFKKIEELMNVQGIGEKSFLKLKPQLTVGGNAASPQPK